MTGKKYIHDDVGGASGYAPAGGKFPDQRVRRTPDAETAFSFLHVHGCEKLVISSVFSLAA